MMAPPLRTSAATALRPGASGSLTSGESAASVIGGELPAYDQSFRPLSSARTASSGEGAGSGTKKK